jgi:hypothetical protein
MQSIKLTEVWHGDEIEMVSKRGLTAGGPLY